MILSKMLKIWCFVFLPLILVFFFSLFCSASELDTNFIQIVAEHRLLDSQEDLFNDEVRYWYQKDSVQSDNSFENGVELVELRTSNTRTFDRGEVGKLTKRFYSDNQMYYNDFDDLWYWVGSATTTIDEWDSTMSSLPDEFSFFPKVAIAQISTSSYSTVGDGYVLHNGSLTWSDHQDALVGTNSADSNTTSITWSRWETGAPYISIARSFLAFSTNIGSGYEVSTSSLFLYAMSVENDDNDGEDYVAVVGAYQDDVSSLNTGDYDVCGDSIDDPTLLSPQYDITVWAGTTGYKEFELNSLGKDFINLEGYTKLGLREGHDIEDDPIQSGTDIKNKFQFYTFENGSNVPYLEITYFVSTSSTSTSYDILNIDVKNFFNLYSICFVCGLAFGLIKFCIQFIHYKTF